MTTYVLGISCYYHDAAAALLRDGVVVAAAEEERFSRKKHDSGFPERAIAYCLAAEGITIAKVSHVSFYEKPLLKFERVLHQHVSAYPKSLKTFVGSMPSWLTQKLRVQSAIRKKLKYKGEISFIEHHLAHAASTFLVSPFEEAAIVTVDGVGEWTTTTIGRGKGTEIELLEEIVFPDSLGLLYSTITAYLGFSVNNSEYKVMGLAPYGNMDRTSNPYFKKLSKVIDVRADGSYALDLKYFAYHYKDRMPSAALCTLLGGPINPQGAPITKRHSDIAAALQLILEDTLTVILAHAYRKTGCANVVLAGGVALNSVYNGKILRNTPFKKIWIQPNASDGGTAIGAAAYAYHVLLKKPRTYVQQTCYLGPAFTDDEIRAFLDKNQIQYEVLANDEALTAHVADLLVANTVVGWFQGRMEWGPRALGARSILANAGNPEAKELLNEKVKHREKFRPFAPVVCAEDANEYFECDEPLPEATDFMLMVYPVRKKWRKAIPSVTHVDGSGRLQTVRRFQNPLYYDLIKAFGARSGVPILINTSFNIRGEPIVCTPFDAYKCMMGTGIDVLVMGHCLISREANPKDQWDSEKYAND